MITIAIDDEPLALELITGYIRRTPFLEWKGSFDNPLSAGEFLQHEVVDLIFLDIMMPDQSGTEFVRQYPGELKVIFTTASDKYAVEGFRLDAVDYLLKPFSYEDFVVAASKALKLRELERKSTHISTDQQFLFIKSDYKIRRIRFDDILYIEGLKDYVKIYLNHEPKPVISLNSMKALESRLPEKMFMRVHRSFIVNLNHVELVERSRIIFGKTAIPISEGYKDAFQAFLNENFL
jgi:two-component system, LytTR family, response regulator LytT